MTVSGDGAAVSPAQEPARSLRATQAGYLSNSVGGAFFRIGVPIALWIVFVNVASHYHESVKALDVSLREVVEAELASRHCPGLQLNPIGFREFASEHGINHADLYQKRSSRLQELADQLELDLHANPGGGCRRMLDLYGVTGSAPHLLMRR